MNMKKSDVSTPDKYDLFIQRFDQFQSLVDEKKELQEKIAQIQNECQERILPLENELSSVIRRLDQRLSKLEGATEKAESGESGYIKYGRGQLGQAIKNLLRSNPEKAFKPKEIAEALKTKGTSVSLWFNKYGMTDSEIERIPSGKGGKRFVYKVR
ncbi:hypothetical protein CHL67_02365 [Prosthecochloris sp. GSB1]|uniref:hypothetical protein n=1 Tax=Prosthecochloris sp. GSB1 TaxID=281093 RepID=UPI000B8CC431|nr:hypothetical protein [Prosthecochloris sp. GSB1]ASQ89916.1 hypothetical protein CHL67_02365 [Prosthecochloris sp. GSB1]